MFTVDAWRRRLKVALIAALSLAASGQTHAGRLKDLDIFLLFGQSNMSGRGELAGAPAFRHADRVRMFRDGAFVPAQEPVSDDPEAGFGPSLAFANALFHEMHRPVGLINCARGGTKIAQWAASDDPKSLYRTCVNQAKRALAFGRLRGLILYQGEYDSWTLEDATAWSGRATQTLENLRKEFDTPALPVIVTQIGPDPSDVSPASPANILIAAQGALALPHATVVSARDLPFQSDRLHLSQKGQLLLGDRYAKAMWRLLRNAR
jgi:hypothetical protein